VSDCRNSNINNLELELEWLEDFSIINNGKYISIHQIKALKSKYLSTYSPAICDLATKLMGFIPDSVFERFFSKIKPKPRTRLINQLKKELIDCKIIDDNNLILISDSSLVKVIRFENIEFQKIELIIKNTIIFYVKLKDNLRFIKAYLHTIKPVKFNTEDLLNQPKIAALKKRNLVTPEKFDDILDRILPYEDYDIYSDCCSKKINELNIGLINNMFLKNNGIYKGFGNIELAKKIYLHLRMHFDDHVGLRHLNKTNNTDIINEDGIESVLKIKWKEVYDIIKTSEEKLDKPTEKKKAYILKEEFESQFLEEARMLEREIQDEEERINLFSRIRDRMDYISKNYTIENFLEFCKIISPRRDSKKYTKMLDPNDGIRNPYLRFFSGVRNELGNGDNHKFKIENKFYLPTIITHDNGFDVSDTIMNNHNLPEIVFDTDYIVTKALSGKSIQEYLGGISTDISEGIEFDDELEEFRITKIKSVELIDIKTTLKRFNND